MAGSNNTCKTCIYWLDQSIIGLCRRNPKNEHKHQHEWCGEFSGATLELVVDTSVAKVKRKYTRRTDVKAAA